MVESIENFGKYTLLERVAVGGMAEIYRAKTVGLGGFEKLLAIKRLHPHFGREKDIAQMLVDEARIAVHLTHPNIAQIFDLGCIQGQYFIAMEFIDGLDLHQISKAVRQRGESIPVAALVFIMAEALGGLHYAHSRSDADGRPLEIVHRDVSPQNIMISHEGEVKLVDFGIAKAQLNDESDTQHGIIKGKFYYMSPEQAYGHHIDHRTDIFAAGMVLYELLVGKNPYQGIDEAQLLKLVRKADFAPVFAVLPDLDPQLVEIITRATRRDAQQRYESALDMQAALVAYLDRQGEPYRRTELAQYVRNLVGGHSEHDTRSAMSRVDYQADEASMIFAPGSSLLDELEELERAEAENPFREEEATRIWGAEGAKPADHIRGQMGRVDGPAAGFAPPAGFGPPASFGPPGKFGPPGGAIPNPQAQVTARLSSIDGATPQDSEAFGPDHEADTNEQTFESALPLVERLLPASLRRAPVVVGVLCAAVLLLVVVMIAVGGMGSGAQGDAAEVASAPLANAQPAPVPAPAASQSMDVRMVSVPSGARVLVDGEAVGVTPLTLSAVPLQRVIEIEVSSQGYDSEERVVQIKEDTDLLEFKLQPVGGVLKVTTYPTNAEVRVNGKVRGRSPVDVSGLVREDVHEVVATLEDGREVRQQVRWQDLSARVTQVSLTFDSAKSAPQPAAKPRARTSTRKPRKSAPKNGSRSQPIGLFDGNDTPKKPAKKKPTKTKVLDIWGN